MKFFDKITGRDEARDYATGLLFDHSGAANVSLGTAMLRTFGPNATNIAGLPPLYGGQIPQHPELHDTQVAHEDAMRAIANNASSQAGITAVNEIVQTPEMEQHLYVNAIDFQGGQIAVDSMIDQTTEVPLSRNDLGLAA
jgi:hypothetical protein